MLNQGCAECKLLMPRIKNNNLNLIIEKQKQTDIPLMIID